MDSLKYTFPLLISFLLLSLIGAALLPFVPVQLKPSTVQNSISVNFSWPEASPRAIEQEVTSVLEGAFNSLKGVTYVSSESSVGWGNIYIAFGDKVNMDIARFEAAVIIRNLYQSLPQGVSYPNVYQGGSNANSNPVLIYTILSPHGFASLPQLIDEKVVKHFNTLEGVEKTDVYGISSSRWSVVYDADKMDKLGITESDLRTAIGNTRLRNPVGKLNYQSERRVMQMNVVLESPYNRQIEWYSLPITRSGIKIVELGEIASVKMEESPPGSYYRINGLDTNTIAIFAREGENQLALVNQLKAEAKRIEAFLPDGVSLLLSSDPTEYVKKEIFNISWRTGLTLVILLLFVFAVSRSWKYLLIIFLSLLVNLAIAFILYYIFNIEIHLYSIAGITVSFGLLIDNSIIMIDHVRVKHNLRVFLAILASTLTTIAALGVVFFLSENLQHNLVDFVKIVIINLFVSLFVALFFIPALMQQMNFMKRSGLKRKNIRPKRRIVRFSRIYSKAIIFLVRFKVAVFVIAILGFGLPVFLLPSKIEKKTVISNYSISIEKEDIGFWPNLYNATFGSSFYNEVLRKPIDLILGGSLRLFLQKVDGHNYFTEKSQTMLHINVYMPDGAVVSQMNDAVIRLEGYLKQFKEINQFEARVQSGAYAHITISFKPGHEFSGFPYYLKDMLTSFAIGLGSADCQVYGVGDGFSNVMREQAGSYKVRFQGYNYDELYAYTQQLKDTLLLNPRIKEVNITEKDTWYRNNAQQFALSIDQEKLAINNNYLPGLYNDLRMLSAKDVNAGEATSDGVRRPVVLSSSYQRQFDRWNLKNDMIASGNQTTRLEAVGEVKKERTAGSVVKNNQNYLLFLEYEFIGPYQLGHMHLDEAMEKFTATLPMGYSAEQLNRGFLKEKTEQNLSLLVIILLIFFICSILFESLRQPLAILMIIPFTFIGVFLTYHFLDVGFNQGGYAAMILLSGLTVNSTIYIINEMNNLKQTFKGSKLRLYLKAFNSKIIPIILTILSTMLGLVPFIIDGNMDKFWYALVTGTIGGLLFSVAGIYFYLPLFLMKKKDLKKGFNVQKV